MRGIVKQLDPYRRVVIPKETLAATGLDVGDYVLLSLGESPEGQPALILTKYHQSCIFCNNPLHVGRFSELYGQKVCDLCKQRLKEG